MTTAIDRTVNPDRQRHWVKTAQASAEDPRGDRVGMTAPQRHQLEITALQRLNRVDPQHWVTPELISTDSTALTITLRWAGWNLTDCISRGIRPQFKDLRRDCDLIVGLLAAAEIQLLDWHRENLLWNPETLRLVMIDFDSIALTDQLPNTVQQQALIKNPSLTAADQLRQWLLAAAEIL